MFKKRKTPEGVGGRSSKEGNYPIYNAKTRFRYETEDESYRRYKHRCYRNLVLKSLLSLLIGMLFAYFFL